MARSKNQNSQQMNSYWSRHGQAFFISLGKLWRQPLANIMTIAVIGIALALPATLYIVLQNIHSVGAGWNDNAQITLFLKKDVTDPQAKIVEQQLRSESDIGRVTYVNPSQGLRQFEKQSGFGNVLQQLSSNPLPGVLVIEPAATLTTPIEIQSLLEQLKQLPEVDIAQLDMGWITRLFGIINVLETAVWALAFLLALAVILIVGNTIRLSIQNHRDEIEVTKLVGATDAFVRRPFLYTGILYGFFGALIAYFLVSFLLMLLSGPVSNLSTLYQSSFALSGFSLFAAEMLFIAGMSLGVIGAWIAVGRQLRRIEP